MKANNLVFVTLCATALFCSCTISEIEPIEQPTEPEAIESEATVNGPQRMMSKSSVDSLNFEEVRALLDQRGYNTETLTEYDEYYLIYSDLIFYKKDISEALKQPITYANYASSKNGRYFLSLITFSDSQINSAIQSAVNDWNNVSNTAVNFKANVMGQVNTGRPEVMIYVEPNLNEVNRFLVVDKFALPYKIYINTKHGFWETTKNSSQLQYLFEHALGHILGLDHSTDKTSIMQDEMGLASNPYALWSGISSSDIYNIGKLYPPIPLKYSYTMTPQVQADADKRVRLEKGQTYTITPSFEYTWLTDPIYSYQIISGDAVISPNGKQFTVKMDKLGYTCTVRITATDKLNETHPDGIPYTFDITFYTDKDIPQMSYPTQIEVGEYAEFKVLFNTAGYQNVTYSMSAYEELFDNKSNRNIEINRNGQVFKVKLRDYGRYRFTIKVNYDGHSSTFYYRVARLARPSKRAKSYLIDVPDHYELPSDMNPPRVPTGENRLYEFRTDIGFGDFPTIMNRVVYDLTYYHERMIMHLPGRPDKHEFLEQVVQNQILRVGDRALVENSRYGRYHPDSINYRYHYTIVHPTSTWASYPPDYAEVTGESHN